MATSVDYIEYVCEQIIGEYAVRYKKMFGEYMVYVNDKPILLVCDNCVFVKILPELSELMSAAERGIPYAGAKAHYVLDMDNIEKVSEVIAVLEKITPIPKSKSKKSNR